MAFALLSPQLALSLVAGSLTTLSPCVFPLLPVAIGFALLLVLVGIGILTGGDKWLEAQLLRHLPEAWVNLTVGI